jgi:hypothetical protein
MGEYVYVVARNWIRSMDWAWELVDVYQDKLPASEFVEKKNSNNNCQYRYKIIKKKVR